MQGDYTSKNVLIARGRYRGLKQLPLVKSLPPAVSESQLKLNSNHMRIEIKKKQEYINDEPQESKFSIHFYRAVGIGAGERYTQGLVDLSQEEFIQLKEELNKKQS